MRQRIGKIRVRRSRAADESAEQRHDAVEIEIEEPLERAVWRLGHVEVDEARARPQHAKDLAQGGVDVDDVAQRESHRRAVEARVGERHRHDVAFDEARAAARLAAARRCARSSIGAQKSMPVTSSVGSVRKRSKTRSPVPQQQSRIRASRAAARAAGWPGAASARRGRRSARGWRDRSAARCARTSRVRRLPSTPPCCARWGLGQPPFRRPRGCESKLKSSRRQASKWLLPLPLERGRPPS